MSARFGVVLPFVPTFTVPEFVGLAREVEARGYHAAWTGEVSGADAFTVLSLVLTHTERLCAATGVLPVQTRSPIILGMTAATLGHVAPGRFWLGLGVSSRIIVEQWHGLPFVAGLGQIREAVQVIRAVTSGERVNFDGQHYRLRNFRLTIPPPPEPPRIVLAALGAQMLELAGEVADGVLLNWMGPEAIPAAIRHLETGARRAGRASLAGFEIGAFIRTAVTDDPGPTREALARDITGYAIVDAYADFFRASGFAEEVDEINAAWKSGDRTGAVARVSPRFLDALGVVGPESFCRERFAAFTRAGLTMPVVFPFAPPAGDRRAAVRRTIRAFPA